MKLTSDFAAGQKFPEKYTCDGENISPPLTFDEVPQEAKSLLLVLRDNQSEDNFRIHWLVFNIPPQTKWVEEGTAPKGATEGLCTNNTLGYEGPCPKYYGGVSNYRFDLYALDIVLEVPHTTGYADINKLIEGHVIEKVSLNFHYNNLP